MKDMMDTIYSEMKKNDVILSACEDRIKFYLYPETADMDKPFLTIRPLAPPQSTSYASDKSLGYQFSYQIDVQAYNRKVCKEVQHAVHTVMTSLGFAQQPGGLDEYFEETKRFVDARRYIKTTDLYDTDY